MSVFLILVILVVVILFLSYSYMNYIKIKGLSGVNKLHEFSNYKIFDSKKDKDHINFFSKHKEKENVESIYYIVYTKRKIIEAGNLIKSEKLIKKLKSMLKDKSLKIAIYDLKDAKNHEINDFYLFLEYGYLRFFKYFSPVKIVAFLTLYLAFNLTLLKSLYINTLNLFGIPLQNSLIDSFEFSEIIFFEIAFNMSVALFFILLIIFLLPYLAKYIFCGHYRYIFAHDGKVANLIFSVAFIVFALIAPLGLFIYQNLKILLPNSNISNKDKANDDISLIVNYIKITGYPKIAYSNEKELYIISEDKDRVYYYDLDEVKNKFKDKIKNNKDLCKELSEEDIRISSLKNGFFIKGEIQDSLKSKLNIKNSRALRWSDILDEEDIESIKCD